MYPLCMPVQTKAALSEQQKRGMLSFVLPIRHRRSIHAINQVTNVGGDKSPVGACAPWCNRHEDQTSTPRLPPHKDLNRTE